MFYSFFNSMMNLNADNFTKIYYEELSPGRKMVKGTYMLMMGYSSLAVISALFGKLAAGGLDEDGDGDYADDLFEVVIGSQFELAFAMMPIIGPGIAAGYHEMTGSKPFMTKVGASPAAAGVGTIGRAIGKTFKGEMFDSDLKKAEVRDALNAIGIMTGLPTGPLAKPIIYQKDVSKGKARPSGPVDYVRGLVTGKPGNK